MMELGRTKFVALVLTLGLVVTTLLLALGAVAIVLATLSPILWLLWKRKGSADEVKRDGGASSGRPPRKLSSFQQLLKEMQKPESEWKF